MARNSAVNISYALFFLALVEVLAWSLPLVHSAVGGSSNDLQGYFARETHNVAEVDASLYQKDTIEYALNQHQELRRDTAEQTSQLLTVEEKQKLSDLTAQMGLGFIVRDLQPSVSCLFRCLFLWPHGLLRGKGCCGDCVAFVLVWLFSDWTFRWCTLY